jgi:hypothetical protein
LKYKKAIKLPSHSAKNNDIGVSRELLEINQKENRAIISRPEDRPSSPSEMLKKLAKATIKDIEIGMKKIPSFRGPRKGI